MGLILLIDILGTRGAAKIAFVGEKHWDRKIEIDTTRVVL